MGEEPDPTRMPPDPSTFSLEAQQALLLLQALPDKWEGFSGTFMGKDYSGILDIMALFEIYDKKYVFELLKVLEETLSKTYKEIKPKK